MKFLSYVIRAHFERGNIDHDSFTCHNFIHDQLNPEIKSFPAPNLVKDQ